MYLYNYPSTQAISALGAGSAWEQFEVRLKMTIEWTQRYTPRAWSSEFGDALGGHARANLQAVIERVWRYTWRLWLSQFGDALGDWDRANSEMHLEAGIERVWRCIWRQRSSELRGALGGCDRASLEMQLEAVIEQDWMSTWRRSMDGAPGDETLFITKLTRYRGNVIMWLYLWAVMKSWLMAVDHVRRYAKSWSYIQGSTHNHVNEEKTNNLGWMVYSVYAVHSVCGTRCMLYSMSNHHHVMERSRGIT